MLEVLLLVSVLCSRFQPLEATAGPVFGRIYYVNLDQRPDRRRNMELIGSQLSLRFERQPALYGRDLLGHAGERAREIGYPFSSENRFAAARIPDEREDSVRLGEIGCWQSHVEVLLRIAESRLRYEEEGGPTLVLEDDIDLEKDLEARAHLALLEVPDDWELLFLGFCSEKIAREVTPLVNELSYVLCTHAYVVRNASVAESLLRMINKPEFVLPID